MKREIGRAQAVRIAVVHQIAPLHPTRISRGRQAQNSSSQVPSGGELELRAAPSFTAIFRQREKPVSASDKSACNSLGFFVKTSAPQPVAYRHGERYTVPVPAVGVRRAGQALGSGTSAQARLAHLKMRDDIASLASGTSWYPSVASDQPLLFEQGPSSRFAARAMWG